MIRIFQFIAMTAAFAVPSASAEPLSLEHRTMLRCSAAFAIVANLQEGGEAKKYPPLMRRGREYFVRSAALVMDQTGMDRDAIVAQLRAEAADLASDGTKLDAVMPSCMMLLHSSGL